MGEANSSNTKAEDNFDNSNNSDNSNRNNRNANTNTNGTSNLFIFKNNNRTIGFRL